MKIYFHDNFRKKFLTLPLRMRERLFERLELFQRDPHHSILHNHSVDKAFPGRRSINITGDVRAIFRIIGEDAYFTNIGTHSDLYR